MTKPERPWGRPTGPSGRLGQFIDELDFAGVGTGRHSASTTTVGSIKMLSTFNGLICYSEGAIASSALPTKRMPSSSFSSAVSLVRQYRVPSDGLSGP